MPTIRRASIAGSWGQGGICSFSPQDRGSAPESSPGRCGRIPVESGAHDAVVRTGLELVINEVIPNFHFPEAPAPLVTVVVKLLQHQAMIDHFPCMFELMRIEGVAQAGELLKGDG